MQANKQILNKIIWFFLMFWGISVVGFIAGPFVPTSILSIAGIVLLVLLLTLMFIQNKTFRRFVYFTYSIFTGITFYWLSIIAIDALGKGMLAALFFGTIALFVILGVIGLNIKKDLSGWGKYLFVVILVLIIISLVFFFLRPDNLIMLILAGVFILYAAFSTVYEFNLIAQGYISEDSAIDMGFDIFVSFVILLKNIIQFAIRFKNEYL